jgi:nucleotide-binding universal stress UspA family protein
VIKRILVPLDGSKLSESVLPYVVTLARGLNANVMLLQAVDEPVVDMFDEGRMLWENYQQMRDSADNAARDYLQQQASDLERLGLGATTYLGHGRPFDVILNYAEEYQADLIAMSTHGRSGITRLILGSVAGRVLHGTKTALLLVKPREEDAPRPEARLTDILVPLDMSQHGEAVLPVARDLAKGLGLKVTLAMALPTASQLYVGTEPVAYPGNVLDVAEQSIREYLQAAARQIQEADGLNVEWKVLDGDADDAIVDYASNQMQNNLIAMSTHGRSGLGRWVLGSVTDQVVRSSGDPVLVVRPG